ncbi:hypothetical protein F4824DRAFT_94461 [Ustulina deusta]|nr:hypothetical protein F4823DRAFT_126163 [Ustulina deusta]KAI3337922.1 hypothetical protein F4824DRAFT_94461 [Ustulina deusta]
MHFHMNILAVAGLLAAGVTAQSSSPVTTSSAAHTATSSVTTVAPSSITTARGNNATHSAWSYFNTTVTSVVVVQQLTTLCKEATTLTFNDCKYTATAGQLVVVTNCPCTVTTTVPTLTSSLCPPGVTLPAISAPPPVQVVPAPHVTPTAVIPIQVPSSPPTPSYIHVGGASLVGSGNVNSLVIAAAAAMVVLGL